MRFRKAAVLGAGVMGAQIAAHFANAGVRVRLLDVSRDAAREGLERAKRLKPDPFFTPDAAALIETGGFDEDLASIADADWILEAIVERLDAKQALMARVDGVRRTDAVVSSNTSGIPIASIAEGRSESFRRHWLGTHFFNPPRYLHLLEIIPTADTDPAVVRAITEFGDVRLGKGVVLAKDVPGFIANRIGMFSLMQVFRALESGEYTIEEVDAMTGPAIGRPKSATFRTVDIAGVDVLAHVARTLGFELPGYVTEMVTRGMTGAKAGRGFYKKDGDQILTLDPKTLEYRAKQSAKLGSIEAARPIESVRERTKVLYESKDKVGTFLRATLGPTIEYARKVADEIAYSQEDIDKAMRWGFGWELGPFETAAALQPAAADNSQTPIPNSQTPIPNPQTPIPNSQPPIPNSQPPIANSQPPIPNLQAPISNLQTPIPNLQPPIPNLQPPIPKPRVVRRNSGASLLDIGDGVLQIEFHSKMNAIGGDTIQMLQAGVKEASQNFAAVVVANDAVNFSAGANLMLLLLEAQEGNWEDVDMMVRGFQGATMALKHADVPVVVAPAGLALGGGCEIALHAARVQAAAETYIGLVEVGVGLIPAGGGTKEMLARAMETAPAGSDPLPYVQRVFETIGFAKVATSGPDAKRIGYFRDGDEITMNRDRLLADAKAQALTLARDYTPAQPRSVIRVGGESVLAALKLGVHLAWRAGRISDHDAVIGRKLAWILSGGNLAHAGTVTEQQLLDLEREAFVSLCGERKTQERIAHTLKTGKPLRN
ncbi:MAG TPA: 3-hydroxyacyl-CoA dehydrogenase NAD-binding domain-containing protein [Vicinamibacterales bacterium]|nr:3-hydroxyacyl-CoA dehydrogenase NAD-binding domain-containing protein [Vicinamibacterales bacterium]